MRHLSLLAIMLADAILASAASFQCTFVDSKGKPIKKVEARLIPTTVAEDAEQETVYRKSEGDGEVKVKELADGSYRLEAQREDYVFLRDMLEISGDVETERTLLKEKVFDDRLEEALSAVKASQYETARKHLLQLLEWYPQVPALHENLARVNADLGNGEKAMEYAERAAVLDPERQALPTEIKRVLLHNAGVEALRAGEFKTAQEKFETLTELAPEYAPGWHGLTLAHGKQGRLEKALELINHALELDPGNEEMERLKRILSLNAGIE